MINPMLEGTHTIALEYPNRTIKTEVERAKQGLLEYIKGKLQNYNIELKITVNETIQKNYAYTPHEKYLKLKEINPLIEKFRKEFKLEL